MKSNFRPIRLSVLFLIVKMRTYLDLIFGSWNRNEACLMLHDLNLLVVRCINRPFDPNNAIVESNEILSTGCWLLCCFIRPIVLNQFVPQCIEEIFKDGVWLHGWIHIGKIIEFRQSPSTHRRDSEFWQKSRILPNLYLASLSSVSNTPTSSTSWFDWVAKLNVKIAKLKYVSYCRLRRLPAYMYSHKIDTSSLPYLFYVGNHKILAYYNYA